MSLVVVVVVDDAYGSWFAASTAIASIASAHHTFYQFVPTCRGDIVLLRAHTHSLASALWAQLVIRARATESCRATYIICYVHACYRYIMRRSEPCGSCGAPSENSRFKLILFMRRLCGRGSRTERTGTRRTGMRNMRCDSGETDHLWYTLVRVYCRLDNACDDRMANWKGKLSRKIPVIVSILYIKSNSYAMSI